MNPLKMTVKQFCKHFDACPDGAKWAIENCKTMADAWDTAKLDWAIWIMTREGVSDDKTMRLFACWCARNTPCVGGKTTWDMMPSEDSRNAIVVAERYSIGEATDKELAAAWAAAWAAAEAAEAAEASRAAQENQLRQMLAASEATLTAA